jgi:pimeloyl-ACP methyl ester carboxylesterase
MDNGSYMDSDETGSNQSEMSWTSPSGKIAWRQLGSGDPLILVNGYAASSFDWDQTFLAELAQRSTLIVPDNRGIGRSEGDPGSISIASMAEDIILLADHLDLESFNLLGWSMGGFIAETVAAQSPSATSSIASL